MPLPSTFRWITVGNLIVRNRRNAPHYAPSFSISDVFDVLVDRLNRKTMYRSYSNNSRLMWSALQKEDNLYYYMIFHVGDQNVSGVSFIDFETRLSRDINKKSEEGSHYAAHIVVKKSPDKRGGHLVFLEKVPGLYLSSIKDHLAWAFTDALYQKRAQDDNGKTKHFRPVFDIDGYQSKTIKEALRTGTLQAIEFISVEESYDDGLDEDAIVAEVAHEARWKIRKKVTEVQARKTFGRGCQFCHRFWIPERSQGNVGKDQNEKRTNESYIC